MDRLDVVIIGGGIGGSALGGHLALAGYKVLVLERLTEFTDRVRGEWMAPWGAAELKKVGLYDRFMAAGGHHLTRNIVRAGRVLHRTVLPESFRSRRAHGCLRFPGNWPCRDTPSELPGSGKAI